MTFFDKFTIELIETAVVLTIMILLRVIVTKLVRKFAKSTHIIEHRTNLVIKYIHLLITLLSITLIIIIWGVRTKDIIIAVSSVATIVGVAMVAQWSILSNITAGIILFFSFPFKIGDIIKIHDKDFPVVGEIEDINAFHISLITKDGEIIIYPNNLIFQKGISILKPEYKEIEFED